MAKAPGTLVGKSIEWTRVHHSPAWGLHESLNPHRDLWSDVVVYVMLDFAESTDRAVILAGEEPFAVADGRMREVPTPPRT